MTSHPEASPSKKGGAERRRWPRANAELPIAISIEGHEFQAKLRDVSRAGVCFYLDRPIPMMTVLAFALGLKANGKVHKVRGKGAVVRCQRISPTLQHYEIAVFLHDIADSDRERLEQHVSALAAQSPAP